MAWYIKKWICKNGVEERTKYYVRSDSTGRKEKRNAKREAKRIDSAERQLARTLNNNFTAGEDFHLVLEYGDDTLGKMIEIAEGATGACGDTRNSIYAAGRLDGENFIRRARRECRKQGIELRYVLVTSDMDGDTGEDARLHHHFIVNKEAVEICKAKWRGTAWAGELYNVNGDLSALASYLIRQTRPVDGYQRYCPSRNLEQPITEEPVALVGNAANHGESEMRVPQGCILLYRSNYARGANQYIRYYRPPKERRDDYGEAV